MDTRMNLSTLVDYNLFYGVEKSLDEADALLKGIPSLTLINYISGFAVNLYLTENSEHSGMVQAYLINSLVSKAGNETLAKWKEVLKRQVDSGHAPLILWTYSNLRFYELIFRNFNTLPSRDLTPEESKRVLDAYLILNFEINKKIQIEEEEIRKAADNTQIEELIMTNFIYQKDYASSTDFTNQVTRGQMFFQYLENHPKYGPLVMNYYKSIKVSGYLRMFKNLMVLFTEIGISKDRKQRKQLARLYEYMVAGEIDPAYIETLCVNDRIETYEVDESFGTIRNKFLFKANAVEFFILDVNFLLDHFYKAQVFAFNSFLKSRNVKGNFLSTKAKEFMEGIYLPQLINGCFPSLVKFFGDKALNSNGTELCDVYLRQKSKICIIEFKDVLLNASVKNSANKEKLFAEFDKKFVANQTNNAKGISQLLHAINDIQQYSISFDATLPTNKLTIYPVILYTDYSFGVDGLNKIYKEKFKAELFELHLGQLEVMDITFINLHFFEFFEDYLSGGLLDLFTLLEEFQEHTRDPDYGLTPFEVFTRFYMGNHIKEDLAPPESYLRLQREIIIAT